MKNHTLCIAQNLSVLRKHHGYSQEDVAEKSAYPARRLPNGKPAKPRRI